MNDNTGKSSKKAPARKKRRTKPKSPTKTSKEKSATDVKKRINHNADGNFCVGNKAAEGKRGKSTRQKLAQAFREASTPEDIQKLYKKLLKLALKGNMRACEILLDRLLGKPEAHDELKIDGAVEFNQDETFL